MSGTLQLFSPSCPVQAWVVFHIISKAKFLKICVTFRAVLAVDKKEQAEVYNIYLRKAAEIYGVTRTRQIYEKAIEILSEAESRPMCLRFAEMETKLGEVDRARAIFTHASQMCDPR